ncbi:hypothetical protein DL93DRAFT_2174076 [Clavulina sp. PMI_390]|nr:hypothetical protein DL93DRAFT_2174076 [Clavulina sp. PMI_390]
MGIPAKYNQFDNRLELAAGYYGLFSRPSSRATASYTIDDRVDKMAPIFAKSLPPEATAWEEVLESCNDPDYFAMTRVVLRPNGHYLTISKKNEREHLRDTLEAPLRALPQKRELVHPPRELQQVAVVLPAPEPRLPHLLTIQSQALVLETLRRLKDVKAETVDLAIKVIKAMTVNLALPALLVLPVLLAHLGNLYQFENQGMLHPNNPYAAYTGRRKFMRMTFPNLMDWRDPMLHGLCKETAIGNISMLLKILRLVIALVL